MYQKAACLDVADEVGLLDHVLFPLLGEASGPAEVRLVAQVDGRAHVVEEEGGVDGEGELQTRQHGD